MNHHWSACVFVWILALARGFSHPLVASRYIVSQRAPFTPDALARIRGGQQEESTVEVDLPADAASIPPTNRIQGQSSLPLASMATAVASFAQWYEGSLGRRPILTKSMTAGIIFGLSDLLAQKLEGRNKTSKQAVGVLDMSRVAASAAVGFLYFGPAAHYWYEWVFRILPSTSLLSTLQKAALGQLLFGPSFTCIYFGVGLAQAGKFSLRNWVNKIRNDLFGVWLAGTGYWPLVDVISFSLVPQSYIPLFVNLCSLIWTVYLSIQSNRSSK